MIDFVRLLHLYMPIGWWEDGGEYYSLQLQAEAQTLEFIDGLVDELLLEMDPANANVLLSRWEEVYDLHPAAGESTAKRRARLLEAVARVPLLTQLYMGEQIGQLVDPVSYAVIEHSPFLCDDPDSLTDALGLEMQWTFYVALVRAEAVPAGIDDELREEQELLERIEPAHAEGIVCFDDFLTDDAFSLTDRDLLGA